MSRSIWKNSFSVKWLSIINGQNSNKNRVFNVWSRSSTILSQHIGLKMQIHNGKTWVRRTIIENMIGHKFGEFSYTKKKTIHKSNKIKQVARNLKK